MFECAPALGMTGWAPEVCIYRVLEADQCMHGYLLGVLEVGGGWVSECVWKGNIILCSPFRGVYLK